MRRLATAVLATIPLGAPAANALWSNAARAQGLPPGVMLGMSASDPRRALPQVQAVPRPPRTAGGLVGPRRSADVAVQGVTGQQDYYFAGGQLRRVEFVGSAAEGADNAQAFDRLVSWGRSVYGQEVGANDDPAQYAQWRVGDTQVYAEQSTRPDNVRLVYTLVAARDDAQW